jgi:hypothetical protein
MRVVIPDTNITFDASAKTITISGVYSDLSTGQVLKISDLTTGSIFYDSIRNNNRITVSSGVITHTYTDGEAADADNLQVIIDVPYGGQTCS